MTIKILIHWCVRQILCNHKEQITSISRQYVTRTSSLPLAWHIFRVVFEASHSVFSSSWRSERSSLSRTFLQKQGDNTMRCNYLVTPVVRSWTPCSGSTKFMKCKKTDFFVTFASVWSLCMYTNTFYLVTIAVLNLGSAHNHILNPLTPCLLLNSNPHRLFTCFTSSKSVT